MKRRLLAVVAALCCSACWPIPRWAYLAESRVEVAKVSPRFSDADLERAKRVADQVAKQVGMSPQTDPRIIEIEQVLSANKTPPRRFLSGYSGRTHTSLWPIKMWLEVDLEDRTFHFSILDRMRGSATPVVARIRETMIEKVDAAFPDDAIVHEAHALGPYFDGPFDP